MINPSKTSQERCRTMRHSPASCQGQNTPRPAASLIGHVVWPRLRLMSIAGFPPRRFLCGIGTAALEEPAARRDNREPGRTPLHPTRRARFPRFLRRLLGDGRPPPAAPLLRRHPARKVGKHLRRANRTCVVFVNLFAVETEPGRSQLHIASVLRGTAYVALTKSRACPAWLQHSPRSHEEHEVFSGTREKRDIRSVRLQPDYMGPPLTANYGNVSRTASGL